MNGILLSADSEVDFMIHGIFSYSFFGHKVWITTTHVCLPVSYTHLDVYKRQFLFHGSYTGLRGKKKFRSVTMKQ